MTDIRERAQAYLELASKATEGPWDYDRGGGDCPAMVYQVSDEIYPDEIARELLEADAEFIAVSRTEGPWLAERLLEALDVLERIAYHTLSPDMDWNLGYVSVKEMARQFFEGSEKR
jgi:hypothetical protein